MKKPEDYSVRARVKFLDGMRGVAAAYVMIGHAYLYIRERVDPAVSQTFRKTLRLLDYGHYAVAIFIVLSGFLLMLPVAQSTHGQLRGGSAGFIRRRARRILPPYVAAVCVSVVVLILVPAVRDVGDLSLGSILTHLLLIHNLFPQYLMSLNGPLWTVAMEWQIYFLLPFAFLPVWKRGGIVALLTVGITLGLLPLAVLPARYNLSWTSPWYVGLFAFGATGALIAFSAEPSAAWVRARARWRISTAALLALLALLFGLEIDAAWRPLWAKDLLLGAIIVSVILALIESPANVPTHRRADPRHRPEQLVLRFLTCRSIATLGTFSYSIYLIHEVLLLAISHVLLQLSWPAATLLIAQFCVGVPVTLALCYTFFRLFERPFLPTSSRTESDAVGG